jgi:hypothetical protein
MKSKRFGLFRRGVRPAAFVLATVVILAGSACSKGSSQTTYNVFVQKFRYQGMPTSIKSGPITIAFSNRESLDITHEMVVIAIPSGKTAQDVINDGKSGGEDSEDNWLHFGEIGEVNTGATIAGVFDLPPGNYAFACWQKGNLGGGEGDVHVARGMIFQFSVSD